jgi:hypothetical protein
MSKFWLDMLCAILYVVHDVIEPVHAAYANVSISTNDIIVPAEKPTFCSSCRNKK